MTGIYDAVDNLLAFADQNSLRNTYGYDASYTNPPPSFSQRVYSLKAVAPIANDVIE
jgi:hypothetical protein